MSTDEAKQDLLKAIEHQEMFDARLAALDAVDRFDATFGVETSSTLENWEVEEATDRSLQHNSRYSPTPVRTIRQVLATVPLNYENAAFIDFGSGKGRALLAAAEFPFKRIVGVDYSSQLCAIARVNIDRYRSATQRYRSIEVHCQDATDFTVPPDAGCFYFYEPFSAAVAETVLDNIESSLRGHPREAAVCLVGNSLNAVVETRSSWTRFGDPLSSPDDSYYDATIYVWATRRPDLGSRAAPPGR